MDAKQITAALRRGIDQTVKTFRLHEPPIILAVLIVALGSWFFIELADNVLERETALFDDTVYGWFRDPADPSRPRGPLWLHEVGRDITALGSTSVLVLVTVAVVGFLALQGARRTMWLVIGAVGSGIVLVATLKHLIGRERPPGASEYYAGGQTSFPSGHSMLAAVVYLSLAVLLTRVETATSLKIYTVAVGLFATFAVGLSRVYLGVHYPTDVLGGWALGVVWALAWWLAPKYLLSKPDRESKLKPE